ncbi:MAG: NUDIX domain-containing protein [Micrococcales bacterium]|nr:NUDIX domain-containing protein [Micrococcales bacterium]MCL2666439.1 NUDIX domain-containing protein [Micrococcales bacterium]
MVTAPQDPKPSQALGLRFRRAARVILVDPDDRVLMLRGHDADQESRSWWLVVGGGLDDGETFREAALREVREETGIELADDAVVGPVFTRSAVFDFVFERWRQDEELFYARVGPGTTVTTSGWTKEEEELLDDLRWFTLDELAAVDLEVFPLGLVELVRGLLDGWDGVTRHLDETRP